MIERIFIQVYLLFFFTVFQSKAQEQDVLGQLVEIEIQSGRVGDLFEVLEEKAGVSIAFSNNEIDVEKEVNDYNLTTTVSNHLDNILGEDFFDYHYKAGSRKIIIKKKAYSKTITLSGYVRDEETGEELIGANVYLDSLNIGTTTNLYGYYSLSIPAGDYRLSFSYVSYDLSQTNLSLFNNETINIDLSPAGVELQNVVVQASSVDNPVDNLEMGTAKLGINTVKKSPALLGESDPLQTIQLMSGVSSVGEGSLGINVRGGSIDQNLILLDEAPVFNPSHLIGFFSIFNPDAIKGMTLYKGSAPARYGGRISSVLDIRQKEGNTKAFKGNGGLGTVFGRLTLEAPIIKDKGAFIVSGRRSYIDLLLKAATSEADMAEVFYYDLNVKGNYKLNQNNRLFLSGYFGKDAFGFDDLFSLRWGNTTGTIRWNHIFNDKLFSNFTAIYSQYDYRISIDLPLQISQRSGIANYNFKSDLTFFMDPDNTIDFGVNTITYDFQLGDINVPESEELQEFEIQPETAQETAVYFNHERKLNSQLSLQYGLRYSTYVNLGATVLPIYQKGLPRSDATIIDTLRFKKGEVVKFYHGPEPRMTLKFNPTKTSSLKINYSRNRQYLQLISNTTSATPVDIWRSASTYIKPLVSDQVSLGYFRNLEKLGFDLSFEIYYKKIRNLLDYKQGAELLLNDNLETELLEGIGRAYGAELTLTKSIGKLNGWLTYTLSRSERKVSGNSPEERINEGAYYPSNYDKTHDISLATIYEANKRWSFGANFVLTSGRAITFPSSRYEYGGFIVPDSPERNNQRLPAYHRLDLSATLDGKKNKRWQGSWTFSIYNVYLRRNAYSIFFREKKDSPFETEAVRLSILGALIPGVTYNFKF